VFLPAGEKDVDNLRDVGLVATTNPLGEGPGKWLPAYTDMLRNRVVVVCEDNDVTGRARVEEVAAALSGCARSVKLLTFHDLPEHGDVSDWLDRGGTAEQLLHMAADAPEWEASATIRAEGTRRNADPPYPPALDDAAFYGFMGDYVNAVEPHTEADPAALLFQLLVELGNVIGHQCHFTIEATRHALNLFLVVVGRSSVARKGTSFDHTPKGSVLPDSSWKAGTKGCCWSFGPRSTNKTGVFPQAAT